MNRLDMMLQGISEEAMLADGFDDCIVGVCDKMGRAVYDADAVVNKLMRENGWDWFEAREYYEFNILGSYVGDMTPLLIQFLKP